MVEDHAGKKVNVGDQIRVLADVGSVFKDELAIVKSIEHDGIYVDFSDHRTTIWLSSPYFEIVPVVTEAEIAETIESIRRAL